MYQVSLKSGNGLERSYITAVLQITTGSQPNTATHQGERLGDFQVVLIGLPAACHNGARRKCAAVGVHPKEGDISRRASPVDYPRQIVSIHSCK